jgi:hypothetical protein
MIVREEKRRTRRKTFPSVTFFTTNQTWNNGEANPGIHGQRPVTNRLSHSTALTWFRVGNSGRVFLITAMDIWVL